MEELPENLRIHASSTESENHVIQHIKDSGKKILFMKTSTELQHASEEHKEKEKEKEKEAQEAIVRINSVHVLVDYIENLIAGQRQSQTTLPKGLDTAVWQTWLQHPERLLISTAGLPEALVKKAADRAEKVQKAARQYLDDFERTAAHHRAVGTFHIHSLQWNWILNYKGGNYYDFDSSRGTIAILNAKNGTGKSNFFEIICIALFGEGFPSRENANYSAGMICDKKPEGFSPSTTIVFSVHGVKYKLARIMRTNTVARLINYDKIVLSVVEEDEDTHKETVLHQQTKAVQNWLDTNMGSLETYLMTAMLSQNADRDFFAMDKGKQKNLLDGIMSMDHITSLKTFLVEAGKYYKYVCDLIEAYQGGITLGASPVLLQELAAARAVMEQTGTAMAALKAQWDHVSERELQTVTPVVPLESAPLETVPSESPSLELLVKRQEELDRDLTTYATMLHDVGDRMDIVDDSVETNMTAAKLNKNRIHMAHLRELLEEHPFYKERGLCSRVENVDEAYANQECSQELAAACRAFETWRDIQCAEFADIEQVDVQGQTERLAQLKAVLSEAPKALVATQKQMKVMRKKYLVKQAEKEEQQDKRPNRPSRNGAWLQATESRLEATKVRLEATKVRLQATESRLEATDATYATRAFTLEHAIALEQQWTAAIQAIPLLASSLQSLSSSIRTMETYVQECTNTPFNAKCKACRAQPWKKTYDDYVAQLPILNAQRSEKEGALRVHCANADVEDIDKEAIVAHLKAKAAEVSEWTAMYLEYQQESHLHAEYDEWTLYYDLLCQECTAAEHRCEELEVACQEQEAAIAAAIEEKHAIETVMSRLTYQRQRYDAYQVELATRSAAFEEHTRQLEYNWYSVLTEYHTYVSQFVVFVRGQIRERQAEREEVATHLASAQRAAAQRRVHDAYPAWQQWLTVTAEHQAAVLLVRELETKCGNHHSKAGIDLEGMKETTGIIGYLADKFDGYREWLYKGHIGPLMETHVNRVLARICEDRPLHLEAEWLDKIHTLSWFVRDGASRPVIEKASGYQRFIVGIAMRVAFQQIGFCRLRCDQLFIDEGFTSCDAENLERVPAFLRGLLSQYDSIYLATHLEELKGCSTVQICIQRDGEGLSQIRMGGTNAESAIVEEPPKKKGRPAKNKEKATTATSVTVVKHL